MDKRSFACSPGKIDRIYEIIFKSRIDSKCIKIMKEKNIVYSTDPNWEKQDKEDNQQSTSRQAANQTAYIERDRKKRAGKVVTVISNLQGDLKSLQKEMQKLCGSGGTVKNGKIEIQGDHRDKITAYLQNKNIRTKFVGG